MFRFIYSVLLIILLPVVPWWFLGSFVLLGIIYFKRYFEAIGLVFFYDLLFGLPNGGWFKTQFTFTIFFLIIFFLVEGYRDRLRFHG